ncbi:MAG TPA: YncE family protein [Terracidiphilus sp.]|jgi:YVTN family beta-propeller protein
MQSVLSRWALPLLATSLAIPSVVVAQANYQVIDQWKIGGDGGWDYLVADGAAHRLYITHGTKVDVVDATSGKITGSITGLHGTHGVALDPEGKYGYISDGGGNAVVVFDRSRLATVATIPAGTNPDAIIYEPATKTVWAFNGRSKDASVIDAATNKVVATISLPGKPEFAQVDGQGNLYDNIEDKNVIVKLDAKAKKVVATWPITCDSPSGLAIDTDEHRLFSVCDGKKMSVVDYSSGKELGTATIGDGPDAAAYDAKDKLAFASCGEGVLSVVNAGASGYPTVQTVPTQRRARTMTYDPTTDRIYTVTAEFGQAPAATADNPRPRPPVVPGSFTVLVIGRK